MRQISKLFPVALRRKIYQTVANQVKYYEEKSEREIEATLPNVELKAEHIKNLRILINKPALLDFLPKQAVVGEIGVSRGDYSEKILSQTLPRNLHLIDAWKDKRYGSFKEIVENRFAKEINLGQVFICQGFSTTVLESFDDGYFDWVYIDSNHTYETTARELELCLKKVKPNGIIAGHDYVTGSWLKKIRYGVIEAVNEFCTKNNWEMIYLTNEPHRHLSFALKQIDI